MLLICINGASASGKTVLSRLLQQTFEKAFVKSGRSSQILSMDDYYHERPQGVDPLVFRATTNFDTPAMLHLDRLRDDLTALNQGQSITKNIFDFVSNRYVNTETVQPSDVVIIEGLFAAKFAKTLPAELSKYVIHVQTSSYFSLLERRSKRDILERGRINKAEVLKYERKHVGEGYFKYTVSHANSADLYVTNDDVARQVDNIALITAVNTIVDAFYAAEYDASLQAVAALFEENNSADALMTNPVSKTKEQRIAKSHLQAAFMQDRIPCFNASVFDKSFNGLFSEEQHTVRVQQAPLALKPFYVHQATGSQDDLQIHHRMNY